jgi:hypothetical protein
MSKIEIKKRLAFYATKKETRGLDVLLALGAVIPSRGEYDKFYFKEKEYPIEKIRISRTSEGYIVSLNK